MVANAASIWIGEHGNHGSIGNEFVQQAKRLAGDQGGEEAHARDIATRPIEAGNVALLDRVASAREHNRNGLCRRHGCQYRSAASGRGDHVDLAADQIGRQGGQSIVLVLCKTGFNYHVAAVDIARFTQAAAERGLDVEPVIFAERVQEADHRHCGLLRTRRERPRDGRAAHERDELASLHSITSSAMASRPGGKVRRNTLAVLRLMTSSNLADCMTGKSAGF